MSSIRHFTFIKDFCVAFLYKIKSKSNLVTPVVVERLKQINLSSVQKSIFRDFVRESTVPEKAFFINLMTFKEVTTIVFKWLDTFFDLLVSDTSNKCIRDPYSVQISPNVTEHFVCWTYKKNHFVVDLVSLFSFVASFIRFLHNNLSTDKPNLLGSPKVLVNYKLCNQK